MNPENDEEQPTQNPTPNDIVRPAVSESETEAPSSITSDSPPVAGSTPEPSTPKTHTPKSKKVMAILLIVLLLVGTAVTAYWYLNKDSSPTQQTTTEQKKEVELLRYGTGEGTLNGFAPGAADYNPVTLFLNRQIFEGLVRFEETSKIRPALATSWENPDDTTWVFTLKSNVKFHSGNTLTAKDVVYSYEQMKKNEDLSGLAVTTIKSVKALENDTKVEIKTDGVDPILLNRLTNLFIIDASANGKNDPLYGTGPYQLKTGTTPTEKSIELAAFDDYHGGKVYTREVQITRYDDEEDKPGSGETAMLADLQADKLDIIGHISGKRLEAAKTASLKTLPVEDTAVYYLNLATNLDGSPVTKQKVRLAMYQAIDLPALLKAIGRDQTAVSANQILPKLIPGYNPEIVKPDYDVSAAKKLLVEAGYANGAPITLSVYISAQDVGKELKRQLELAGFEVNLVLESSVDKFFADYDAGIQEVGYGSYASDFGDASDVFAIGVPPANYTNTKLADILKKADSTLDQTARLNYYKEASEIVMDDVAVVPLYTNQPTWVASKPFVITQDMFANDLNAYLYKIYLSE